MLGKVQYQKGISPTISKYHVDDLWDIHNAKRKKETIIPFSFLSLPTTTTNRPTFWHCWLPQFAFGCSKPTHYLQNIHPDLSKYQQIYIWEIHERDIGNTRKLKEIQTRKNSIFGYLSRSERVKILHKYYTAVIGTAFTTTKRAPDTKVQNSAFWNTSE